MKMFPETENIKTFFQDSCSINMKYGIESLNSVTGNIEYRKILTDSILIFKTVSSNYLPILRV